ncbi:MAG: CarD family transcriptional regulator [bacterium]
MDTELEVGETIIYPHYGAGEIVEEETLERDEEEEEYFIIEIFLRDLRIMVPKDREEIDEDEEDIEEFRGLVDEDTIMDKLEEIESHILEEEYEDGEIPKVPRNRLEEMEDNIKLGDLDDTAEALARLHAKFLERDMNIGEKRVYDLAKEFCTGELMGIFDYDENEAKNKLYEYLPSTIPNLEEDEEEEDEEEEEEEYDDD